MLVPSRGFTSSVSTGSAETVFHVSRPIPAGVIVSRAAVTLRFGGTSVISWRAVLSASNEGSEAALRQGVPMVDRAQTLFLGLPSIVVTGLIDQVLRFELFPGLRATAGPSFVIVSVSNVAGVAVSVMSAFEMVEVVRDDPRADPGLPER